MQIFVFGAGILYMVSVNSPLPFNHGYTTKSHRVVSYDEVVTRDHMDIVSFDHVVTWDHITNEKCFISFSTKPMANTHDEVVVYDIGPLIIKSHGPTIPWSCKFTRKIKILDPDLHQVYGHQKILSSGLIYGATNHKVIQTFDYVLMWGYVVNEKH